MRKTLSPLDSATLATLRRAIDYTEWSMALDHAAVVTPGKATLEVWVSTWPCWQGLHLLDNRPVVIGRFSQLKTSLGQEVYIYGELKYDNHDQHDRIPGACLPEVLG